MKNLQASRINDDNDRSSCIDEIPDDIDERAGRANPNDISLRDAIEIVSRLDDRPPAPPGYDLLYDRDGKPKLRTFFFLLPCIAVGFLLCSFEPVLDVVGYVLVTLGCTGLVGWVIESLLFQTGCRR